MSKESRQDREPHQQDQLFQDFLPEWSFGILGLLVDGKNQLQRIWSSKTSNEVTSGHKNWDNTSFCRRLSVDAERQYSVDEILDTLGPNFETFTDEYSVGTPVKTYRFSFFNEENGSSGSNGVDGAYKENLKQQAIRFQTEKVALAGKRQQRAAIETFNSSRLDIWISEAFRTEAIPDGTKLIWFSPPGHKVEGYHGTSAKHHSFIWVYEKKRDEGGTYIEMTQFRCWPSLRQIQKTQNHLQQFSTRTGGLKPFSAEVKLTRRNSVIAKMLEVSPQTSLEQIKASLYDGQHQWAVKESEMPYTQMNDSIRAAYIARRDQLLEAFLKPTYKRLLGTKETLEMLQHPFESASWKSDKYRQIIGKLDFAFSLSKQALDKWIENALQGNVSDSIPIDSVETLFQLGSKHLEGGLTDQEKNLFNSLAPIALSVGNQLLSVGQCGIGTIIPLNLITKLNVQGIATGTPSVGFIDRPNISALSSKEKKQFQKDVLGMYAPLRVRDNKGNDHKFWVRKEYFDEYVGHCYEDDDGILVGPCGVPLTMKDDEFILTDEKYQELLAASQEKSNESELRRLDQEEKAALLNAQSSQEQDAIRNKYRQLRSKLKNVISITELLNNDVFSQRAALAA